MIDPQFENVAGYFVRWGLGLFIDSFPRTCRYIVFNMYRGRVGKDIAYSIVKDPIDLRILLFILFYYSYRSKK